MMRLVLVLVVLGCGTPKKAAEPGGTIGSDETRSDTGSDETPVVAAPSCDSTERTLYACPFVGGGGLAVCGDEGLHSLAVLATGAVEVDRIASGDDDVEATFDLYLYTRALVSYQGLGFTDDDKEFFVFYEFNEEEGPEPASTGIRVGEVVVPCAVEAQGWLMDLETWLTPSMDYPGP